MAALLLSAFSAEGLEAGQRPGNLTTIQDYVESLQGPANTSLDNPISVFRFVFSNIPERVVVYPTENYFYFQFYKDGISISGNLRLDALGRDKGVVSFAYFSTYRAWSGEKIARFHSLSSKDGMVLKKISALEYDMQFEGRTVRFSLNDLSKVQPPENKTHSDERYLGPVFDESGIQFYLFYNFSEKTFLYVLNQQKADQLTPSPNNPDMLIGHRTGFVYYRDPKLDRLILIGVNQNNTNMNNYFDGPFDQLPDNFIKGESFRDAVLDQRPAYKGVIDRLGNYDGGESRVVIAPYIQYYRLKELAPVKACLDALPKKPDTKIYHCFDVALNGSDAANR